MWWHLGRFLVKWKGLDYDQATWEDADVIPDAAEQIDIFLNQISIRQEARKRMKEKFKRENASPSMHIDKEVGTPSTHLLYQRYETYE